MLAGVAVGCRALLVVVLGFAFVSKASSRAARNGLADSLTVLPWVPRWRRPALARAILVAEGAGALLAALPVTALAGLVLAAVLMALFTIIPAVSLRQGIELTCRCFGVREAKIGPSHVVRNGVALCAAVAGLAGSLAAGPGTAWSPVAIGTGVIAGIIFVGWDEIAYLIRPPAQPESHPQRTRS